MSANPADELQPIFHAAEGLLYPSESDEPFEVFAWPGNSAADPEAAICVNAGIKEPLQEVRVEDFFAELQSTSNAARFAELRRALTAALKNLKVYRTGKVQVKIFLIGRAPNGDWIAVRTMSVET